jgi:hypothetical protein
MYIYNVTTNIDETVQQEWLKWMKEKHIPEMLETGMFSNARMSQVLIEEEMGGITYSVQYTTESLETLHEYHKKYAEKFHQKSVTLFKDKFVTFKTEMKVITEQFSMSLKN